MSDSTTTGVRMRKACAIFVVVIALVATLFAAMSVSHHSTARADTADGVSWTMLYSSQQASSSNKVTLAYQTTRGYRTSAKCVKAPSFSKVPKGAKCWIATKKGFKYSNSGVQRNGHRLYFGDYIGSRYSPVGTRFYWDAKHRSWRKANCGNFVKFRPGPSRRVNLVKTFSNITVKVQVLAHETASSTATASCQTANSSASSSATATASGSSSAVAVASARTQSQAVSSAVNSVKDKVQNDAYANAQANAYATAYAEAQASCSSSSPSPSPSESASPTPTPTPSTPTPTPSSPTPIPSQSTTPPPTQHFTNISCTSPEEISGGGSFLVDCDVSNDNGAPIALNVNSNDGNSRVSGVNCISQGGTPSCQGNGTFEFRVTGINNGTSVVYSSFTAVASSNGVNATYNSGQFPVDPSGGGF